jgi:hypothetical protein
LGVSREDFGHGLFKLPACFYQASNLLDPLSGDMLHALLAPGHEGERPNGVPLLVLSAMASGLTAAPVGERKRTGEEIGRDSEATEEFELALTESSGLRTFGCNLHMNVIIHAVVASQVLFLGMRK